MRNLTDCSAKSTHDLLATMSGMDYVITCRFHGVVFAHLLNKPVLAIAHHPKVVDLMTDLELSSYFRWIFPPFGTPFRNFVERSIGDVSNRVDERQHHPGLRDLR
jgi:polysaccharide pyruvyl transferase WcaK-like protein